MRCQKISSSIIEAKIPLCIFEALLLEFSPLFHVDYMLKKSIVGGNLLQVIMETLHRDFSSPKKQHQHNEKVGWELSSTRVCVFFFVKPRQAWKIASDGSIESEQFFFVKGISSMHAIILKRKKILVRRKSEVNKLSTLKMQWHSKDFFSSRFFFRSLFEIFLF